MRLISAAFAALCVAVGGAAADDYDAVRAALDTGDYETAYATLAEMGDAGDTLAMIMLSNLQLAEVTGPANLGLAIAWLEQAAEQGSIHALLRLGAIHERHGQTLFPDRPVAVTMGAGFPEAVEYYRQAEEAGSSVALSRLGLLYRLTLMSANDPAITKEEELQLSRDYLERAVAAGRTDAMYALAMQIRRDEPDRAAELFRQAAAAGEPTAVGSLAARPDMFGVTDPVEALAWAYAARTAWELDPNPRSNLFTMAGADNGRAFMEMMETLILAASPEDRTAAETRAADITAGWTSLLPGRSRSGGGGLFGRD